MPLPPDFQFSQSSLQDFETCPRRFELRYLQRLSWPAIESEPIQVAERLAQLGADFHRPTSRNCASGGKIIWRLAQPLWPVRPIFLS